jgi:hypothetical protein
MGVLVTFNYELPPGRLAGLLDGLGKASSATFDGPAAPKSVFLAGYESDGTGHLTLTIKYADRAAMGGRVGHAHFSPEWQRLLKATPEFPKRLVSVILLPEEPLSARSGAAPWIH